MAMGVEARFLGASRPLHYPAGKAPKTRLAGLDLLRLLAALSVLVFHFGYAGPMRGMMHTGFPELAGVAKYGFAGVDLFFVISGFVIAASVQGRTWLQFAIARLLRLYPAHVVCMTFSAVALATLGGIGTGSSPESVVKWLANLTMVAPALGQPFVDGAYWTIVLEIVFYGWVGLLVAAGLYNRRLLTILALWLLVSFVNEAFFQWRPLRMALVTEYAGMFASGILIHRMHRGDRSLPVLVLLACAICLGAMHAFEAQRVAMKFYGEMPELHVLWLVHAGLYAAFTGALWLSLRLDASPLVLTLGGLTYPLYLVHQNVGYVLIDRLSSEIGRWTALAVVISIILTVALAVCRLAEPAGRGMLKRAIDRLVSRAPVPPQRLQQAS